MQNGHIYILKNPSIPGQLKIGKTKHAPDKRAAEISSATGVPTAFEVIYSAEVLDVDNTEKLIHQELEVRGYRVSKRREFFTVAEEEAIELVSRYDVAGSAGEDPDALMKEAGVLEHGSARVIKNIGKAEYLYRKAWNLGHTDAGVRLAKLQLEAKRFEPALETALTLLSQNRREGHLLAGKALKEAGQDDHAEHHYQDYFSKVTQGDKPSHEEFFEMLGVFADYLRERSELPPFILASIRKHFVEFSNLFYVTLHNHVGFELFWHQIWTAAVPADLLEQAKEPVRRELATARKKGWAEFGVGLMLLTTAVASSSTGLSVALGFFGLGAWVLSNENRKKAAALKSKLARFVPVPGFMKFEEDSSHFEWLDISQMNVRYRDSEETLA